MNKFREHFTTYVKKTKIWSETTDLKRLHRILFAFIATVLAIFFGLSVIHQMWQPLPAKDVSYKDLVPFRYKLSPGVYNIFGVDDTNTNQPFLFLGDSSGGALLAVQPPEGVDISDIIKDYSQYRLEVQDHDRWNLIKNQDVHNGHPLVENQDSKRAE